MPANGRSGSCPYSDDVLAALECVTKRQGETYEEFVERAAANTLARRVATGYLGVVALL
jgi:hypothetical protein